MVLLGQWVHPIAYTQGKLPCLSRPDGLPDQRLRSGRGGGKGGEGWWFLWQSWNQVVSPSQRRPRREPTTCVLSTLACDLLFHVIVGLVSGFLLLSHSLPFAHLLLFIPR